MIFYTLYITDVCDIIQYIVDVCDIIYIVHDRCMWYYIHCQQKEHLCWKLLYPVFSSFLGMWKMSHSAPWQVGGTTWLASACVSGRDACHFWVCNSENPLLDLLISLLFAYLILHEQKVNLGCVDPLRFRGCCVAKERFSLAWLIQQLKWEFIHNPRHVYVVDDL